jgi:hypothetical protein
MPGPASITRPFAASRAGQRYELSYRVWRFS